MKNLLKWLWAFVPVKARIWVYIAAGVALLGAAAYIGYKIDKGGYDRCQTEHTQAAIKLLSDSRENIVESDRGYENVEWEIISIESGDIIAGARTEHAIDRMPSPDSR